MRSLKLAIVLVLLLGAPCLWGQSQSSVSGTVIDPNGVPYSGGSGTVTFVPGAGTGQPSVITATNQAIPQTQFSITKFDSTGSFTGLLLTRNDLISPPGSQWQFKICDAGGVSPTACFSVSITINTNPQNVSTALQNAAIAHSAFNVGVISTKAITTQYYQDYGSFTTATNPAANFIRVYNNAGTLACLTSSGTSCITGGGGGGTPGGSNGQFQYNAAGSFGGVPDFTFNGTHTLTLGASGILTLTAGATVNGITSAMIPTLNQSTTGNAATATGISTNGTNGQVWGMTSGSTQGWLTSSGGSSSGSSGAVQLSNGSGGFNNVSGFSFAGTTLSVPSAFILSVANASGDTLTWGSTTGVTSSAVITAPAFTANGTGAGYFQCAGGSAPALVTSNIQIVCPTTVTTNYQRVLPGASATGILHLTNSSNVDTESISLVSMTADVTGVLPFANGGTGSGSYTTNCVLKAGASSIGCSSVTDNGTTVAATESITTTGSVSTGTPPSCTLGTGGAWCAGEGSAPTGASSVDDIYANSTSHCMDAINNNTDVGCLAALAATNAFTGAVTLKTMGTATNCSSSASPAVCGSAAAGSVVIAAAATTVQVNTTAVTANSQILVFPDETLGTKLGVTCNSTLATAASGLAVTARTAATSFTITTLATIATNPVCLSYLIVN